MDYSLVINALQLVVYLSSIIILAALGGALVAGILRVTTQIEDPSIGFAGRLTGVVLMCYLAAGYFSSEISEFAARVWGGADFYQ